MIHLSVTDNYKLYDQCDRSAKWEGLLTRLNVIKHTHTKKAPWGRQEHMQQYSTHDHTTVRTQHISTLHHVF